jgi:hypothetical protein
MKKFLLCFLISLSSYAQVARPTLTELSSTINISLPETWDHATKLLRTTVENNNIFYHFVLKASEEEYKWALPKVKAQVLRTICSKSREKSILKDYQANIVYKYESEKGLTLGEFVIKPDHCHKNPG